MKDNVQESKKRKKAVKRRGLGLLFAQANGRKIAAERYVDAVNSSGPRGHGVIAEAANHIADSARGIPSRHIGADNAFNGADRIVKELNRDIWIQTKYCRTGRACIASCFDSTREFRYFVGEKLWEHMQIEVPPECYDDAIEAMKERILAGRLLGVEDPDLAESVHVGAVLTDSCC